MEFCARASYQQQLRAHSANNDQTDFGKTADTRPGSDGDAIPRENKVAKISTSRRGGDEAARGESAGERLRFVAGERGRRLVWGAERRQGHSGSAGCGEEAGRYSHGGSTAWNEAIEEALLRGKKRAGERSGSSWRAFRAGEGYDLVRTSAEDLILTNLGMRWGILKERQRHLLPAQKLLQHELRGKETRLLPPRESRFAFWGYRQRVCQLNQ